MTSKTSNHFLLLTSTLLLLSSLISCEKVCRALVLQGGGDKGAYEAGVLYGFVKHAESPEDFQYDVITGISVGSINGMTLAQFPKGQEEEAVEYLLEGWRNSTQRDVFKSWPGGLLQGLFFKPALFNSDPEIEFLKKRIYTSPNQRMVTVSAADFHTGEKVSFTEKHWGDDLEKAINAALFSTAIPVVFLYRQFENRTLIDGGWSGEGLNVEDAVFRCREIVDSDDQIIVDVIFAQNISFSDVTKDKFNSFQIYQRYLAIRSYAYATRAFTFAKDSYPEVNFRHVMIASHRLPNQNMPLDFKQKNIEYMINLGMKDALEELKEKPGTSAHRVYELAMEYQDSLFFNEEDEEGF